MNTNPAYPPPPIHDLGHLETHGTRIDAIPIGAMIQSYSGYRIRITSHKRGFTTGIDLRAANMKVTFSAEAKVYRLDEETGRIIPPPTPEKRNP